jgi:hypothetical protein
MSSENRLIIPNTFDNDVPPFKDQPGKTLEMEDPIEYPTHPEVLLHDLGRDSLDAGCLVK